MPTPARRLRLRRSAQLTATACALALLGAGAAQAERVDLIQGFASNLNGVATGADGNIYLVETGAQKVSVRAPDGSVVRQVSLPGTPNTATSAALGPDGRVWVALSSSDANRGFARIDAAGASTPLSTVGLLGCGPVGMARLSSVRMIFTAPSDGACSGGSSYLGGLNADGTVPEGEPVAGPAFDLAVAGGKAYVPDYGGDTVARWQMGSQGYFETKEATYNLPGGSGTDGIEAGDDGQIYVTLFNTGQVARIDPAQAGGSAAAVIASGLVNPFGMAVGSDGALYVASQDARLLRIAPDGTQRFIALPAGFKAWQVAQRGDDIWVTDNTAPQAAVVRNAGRPEPTPITPGPGLAPAPALPAPTPVTPKPLTTAQVLSLADAKRCASRRSLTLTLRKRTSGPKVASVKVTIGKGKAKTYKGAKLKLPVKLTGLPKGSFKVKIAVTLSDGTKVNLTRSYKTCAAKKRS